MHSKTERAFRLCKRSSELLAHGFVLSDASNHPRAARAVALADALYHAAGGDKESVRNALDEAKFWRNIERKTANV